MATYPPLPFDVTIPDAEQDKTLPDKLRAEYPGILRWLVKGCLDWQANGLGTASRIEAATAAYRKAEDTFGTFLEARCVEDSTASVGAGELLDAYFAYSGQRISGQRLKTLLEPKGFANTRITSGAGIGRSQYLGLRLIR